IPRVEVLTALDRTASKQIQQLSIRRFKIPDMVEMAPQVFAQALIHERQKVDLGLQSQPLVFRIVYLLVFYCQCLVDRRLFKTSKSNDRLETALACLPRSSRA